jgi:cell division protein FtsB
VNRTEIRRLEALITESNKREIAWLRATVAELTAENANLHDQNNRLVRANQYLHALLQDCRHHPTPPRV